MSYDTEKTKIGREPITMCGIVADYCSLTYGVAPCTAGTAWDVSAASYDNKSFSVASEETVPASVFFKTDGLVMYIVGTANNTVYQYTLTSAWDTSTASYASKSFSVASEESLTKSVFFKPDGLSMYIVGRANNTVYQYTLSTAWDVSTASYTTKSFSVASEETATTSVFFKSDGLSVYVVGTTGDTVYQYTLTTAWDVSTASYASKSFSVASEETVPASVFFKPDGLSMYVVGSENDTVYQYELSTAWDVSTASYTTKSFSVVSEELTPTSVFFKSDGLSMYVVGTISDTVYQYTLSINKCYNTRANCQDTTNYAKTTKEYIFSQPRSSLPIGETIFPLMDGKVKKSGTSTTGGKGLGKRAVVSVKLKDMPHHDRGIDPYVSERTYNPEDQGTFWGKWLTRNPYYDGRTLKVYYGYIGETFSWSDFEVQEYDITDIDGVDNGFVKITAKDVLVRTYDRKSQYPAASEGELLSGITDVATSATLSPTGIGNSDYPASGTLSIGKEAMTFTRSGDILTLTRAQWGTEAKEHDAEDTVQICATWEGAPSTDNVTDVLYELLVTGSGVPSSYIPTADWDIEQDLWLSGATVKGILMKPESIEKVISELSEVFMFDIWWDATVQEVKIKALSPEPSGATINTITEATNIVQGSLKVERRQKDRFTEIRVYYNKTDYSEDDKPEKFASLQVASDVSRASSDLYGENSIKTVVSRWFEAGANAAQLTGRMLSRFADTPEYVTFKLDNKDHGKMEMAGRLELNSWQFQDETGANTSKKFQVLEINPKDDGNDFEVKCLSSSFVGRYFFVTADSMVDYSIATEAQKDANGFICQSTGDFSDGSTGYKLI